MKISKISILVLATVLLAGCVTQGKDKQIVGSLLGAGLGGLAGSKIGGGKGQLAAVAVGTLAGDSLRAEETGVGVSVARTNRHNSTNQRLAPNN